MHVSASYLRPEYFLPVLFNAIRIGFILLFAYITSMLTGRLIRGLRKYAVKTIIRRGGTSDFELEKRTETVIGVARKSLAVLIWSIALIMVLKELNFDIRPLLAGAGLVGVAIGLGAQNLIKDILAGIFMLIENQVRVNDVVVINDVGGLVEEINLRTTILRSEDGAVHIFPNGGITKLSNLTRDFSYYVFTLSLDYDNDPDQVTGALTDIAASLRQEEPYTSAILDRLEILGVDQLNTAAMVLKARIKTQPMKQWLVGREMNRRIKQRFAEAGIHFPQTTQTVYLKELAQPVKPEPPPQPAP